MTLCNLGVSKCRIEQIELFLTREMNLRIKICHKEVLGFWAGRKWLLCRCFLKVTATSRFCSQGQYSLLVAGLFWAELCLCHWLPYRDWHTGLPGLEGSWVKREIFHANWEGFGLLLLLIFCKNGLLACCKYVMQLCNWFFCWKGEPSGPGCYSSLSSWWLQYHYRRYHEQHYHHRQHVGIILFFLAGCQDLSLLTRRIYCTVLKYAQILVSTFLSRSWQTMVSLRRDCSCWVHFCLWRLSYGAGFSAMQRPSVSIGSVSMVRPIDPYSKSLSIFFAEIVPSSCNILQYVTVFLFPNDFWIPAFFNVNSLEGRMALRGYFHQDSLSPVPCHWEAATGRRGDLGVMSQGRLSEVLKANPGKQSWLQAWKLVLFTFGMRSLHLFCQTFPELESSMQLSPLQQRKRPSRRSHCFNMVSVSSTPWIFFEAKKRQCMELQVCGTWADFAFVLSMTWTWTVAMLMVRQPVKVCARFVFDTASWRKQDLYGFWHLPLYTQSSTRSLRIQFGYRMVKERFQGKQDARDDSRAFCASSSWLAAQVVSLGGFWVKLAQTASVISALPDASLGVRTLSQQGMRVTSFHHFDLQKMAPELKDFNKKEDSWLEFFSLSEVCGWAVQATRCYASRSPGRGGKAAEQGELGSPGRAVFRNGELFAGKDSKKIPDYVSLNRIGQAGKKTNSWDSVGAGSRLARAHWAWSRAGSWQCDHCPGTLGVWSVRGHTFLSTECL